MSRRSSGADAGAGTSKFLRIPCVRLPANLDELGVPDLCACCGVATQSENIIANCRGCRVHQVAYKALMVCIGAGSLGAGLYANTVAPTMVATLNAKTHTAVVFAAGIAVSVVAYLLLELLRPRKGHAHWGSSVDRGETDTIFLNASVGARVAKLNRIAPKRIHRFRMGGFTSALLLLLLPAIPAGFAYFGYGDNHLTLYVDNGLEKPITLRLDGRDLLTIDGKGSKKLSLRRMQSRLEAVGEEGSVDGISLVPLSLTKAPDEIHFNGEANVFVWNVDQRNCYAQWTALYDFHGGSQTEDYVVGSSKVIATAADYVLEPSPSEVTLERGDYRLVVIRRELQRTACDESPRPSTTEP